MISHSILYFLRYLLIFTRNLNPPLHNAIHIVHIIVQSNQPRTGAILHFTINCILTKPFRPTAIELLCSIRLAISSVIINHLKINYWNWIESWSLCLQTELNHWSTSWLRYWVNWAKLNWAKFVKHPWPFITSVHE